MVIPCPLSSRGRVLWEYDRPFSREAPTPRARRLPRDAKRALMAPPSLWPPPSKTASVTANALADAAAQKCAAFHPKRRFASPGHSCMMMECFGERAYRMLPPASWGLHFPSSDLQKEREERRPESRWSEADQRRPGEAARLFKEELPRRPVTR
ncbi:unnamed protein product [Durusdinium trenchii]|uniref:Uncharacterized protein n=1 Tax=Durusdinium trenchii TaxID=1381693 RepID=A0ABP0I7B6_9DINO